MKAPLSLVADNLSNDVTELLRQLQREARSGRLHGIAFVAVIQSGEQRGYIANTAGECHRSSTWTRGALLALDDKLAQRIRGGSV